MKITVKLIGPFVQLFGFSEKELDVPAGTTADDLIGLVVGPLFVMAETAFFLGLRKEVADEVTRRSGPTRVGRPQAVPAE